MRTAFLLQPDDRLTLDQIHGGQFVRQISFVPAGLPDRHAYEGDLPPACSACSRKHVHFIHSLRASGGVQAHL